MSFLMNCFEGVLGSKPEKVTLHYFPVFAKGPGIALALSFSGLEWEGKFPEKWPELKPKTPWGELPVLEIPGLGMMGHEAGILNYIARKCPAMAGANDAEFITSQQLCAQSEDIYQKLGKLQNTIMVKDKVSPEVRAAFWMDKDATKHNKDQGLHVYLSHLERYYDACKGGGSGKFTSTGTTIGECKLFVTLHCLVLIQPDVLLPYVGLSTFYNHFKGLQETQELLVSGSKFPGPFNQYFVA
mmetsp:Transcript_61005/g.108457  ORF Transcript_61005/g.108457 Transcript_61005/m.108457 type:complete len:242 (+) Transcript_61005:115-840(+)|eukprot:CAMPEP_0197623372 /NCGR_PEP_ID=MMETSP1338-20131121/3404_1 /TAXON_ID=43686 ORGANISM="Pelagodinium beii, Strain RCC1491" /NCGR_SAMPLE_ID=MMETSP1338 /ASSEMBLY_ACC=CAM_ASM_000754 /LENGTH=241 /DNA_ID=CAMNT_0043193325 /DNA_START=111 /DNA_END=836 /DNA_ORIENTATION=+